MKALRETGGKLSNVAKYKRDLKVARSIHGGIDAIEAAEKQLQEAVMRDAGLSPHGHSRLGSRLGTGAGAGAGAGATGRHGMSHRSWGTGIHHVDDTYDSDPEHEESKGGADTPASATDIGFLNRFEKRVTRLGSFMSNRHGPVELGHVNEVTDAEVHSMVKEKMHLFIGLIRTNDVNLEDAAQALVQKAKSERSLMTSDHARRRVTLGGDTICDCVPSNPWCVVCAPVHTVLAVSAAA